MECPLCKLEKKTDWYFENVMLAVLECKTCNLPMVVLKRHTMEPTAKEEKAMIRELTKVADAFFDEGNWALRKYQRNIKDHLHFHAIPNRS